MTFATPTTSIRDTYQQAKARYEAEPGNPMAIRAMGWALANLLKEVSGHAEPSPARVVRGLTTLSAFPMVPDVRWQESVLWSVNRFLLRLKPDQLSLAELAAIVCQARGFVPAEPCLVRSVWWKALLRHSAAGIDWQGLFDALGWEGGFRPEDEQPETFGDNQTARPLVEGLIQAVAKQLLANVLVPEGLVQPWLERLMDLTARHPDWHFLPYYHARLLQRLDRTGEAMAVYLPFARAKQREFWVWSLLAELVEPVHAGACYARALSCRTPDTFLVKVRQRAAAWLIDQQRWSDARAEIDWLLETRQAQGWPVPAEVADWTNADAYTQAVPSERGSWYAALLPGADALLWADQPETVALVTGLDPTGSYCNVAIDAHTVGSFPCRRFGLSPAVGDRVALRYEMRLKNDRPHLHVLTAIATTAPCSHLITRTVSGPLRLASTQKMGFVGEVYVPADVLLGVASLADQLVTVDAVASWDRVKKKMGWRAYRLTGNS
ncbi:hypothetical protein DYU11_09895 [Fibrisoma montanum]|uniref:TOTE conflict systems S1/CSD-like domain-containing protein n=1 Tax=Fibrisoma montanum TaxID=2305895 RepID=A0A418MFN9_9BACT|nr:hypothetical protein [Fibrisoma montanum]RIV25591.1 hypothetical protein DYU11_09895 [Fibrisoma montanum]